VRPRRIAYYKCVALVEGTNIVRRELALPEAHIRAADRGSTLRISVRLDRMMQSELGRSAR
jgi:hypothetical protein